MFNGIIKNTGIIKKLRRNKKNCSLEVITKMNFLKKEIGSSVSCSGVCLTVESLKKNLISFYVSSETLNRTIFKSSKKGDILNLEKSLKFGERISGHFVQGHVDTTASINKISKVGKSILINFQLHKKYKNLIVQKGSIAINGVSLTVAKILQKGFQISIIPKTLQLTNLINLKKKDTVNVEFDVLGKYIKNFIK